MIADLTVPLIMPQCTVNHRHRFGSLFIRQYNGLQVHQILHTFVSEVKVLKARAESEQVCILLLNELCTCRPIAVYNVKYHAMYK